MSNNRLNQTLTGFLFSNAAVPFTNQLQRLKYFWSSLEKWYLWRLMVAPGRFVDRDRNTVKYISHTVWKNTLWAETVVSSDNEQNSHSFTPCFSSADLWSTCWTDIFFISTSCYKRFSGQPCLLCLKHNRMSWLWICWGTFFCTIKDGTCEAQSLTGKLMNFQQDENESTFWSWFVKTHTQTQNADLTTPWYKPWITYLYIPLN